MTGVRCGQDPPRPSLALETAMPAFLRLALAIVLFAGPVVASAPDSPGWPGNEEDVAGILQRALESPFPREAAPTNTNPTATEASAPPAATSFASAGQNSDECKVSAVLIHGNSRTSSKTIRNRMKTRPGRVYRSFRLGEDVRRLYATRRFGNVWADTVPDGPGRVTVHVYVREFPNRVGTVAYQGNRTLTSQQLAKLTGVRPGMPLNPHANKVACRKIVEHYREKEGRPFACCELIEGGELTDTRVVFRIREGRRSRVQTVGFTGQRQILLTVLRRSSNFLLKLLKAEVEQRPPWLTSDDVRQLIQLYRSAGYPEASIDRDLIYSDDERTVSVILQIHEGPRRKPKDSIGTDEPPLQFIHVPGEGKPIPLSPDFRPDEEDDANGRGLINVRVAR
jgi:hypothetical protein